MALQFSDGYLDLIIMKDCPRWTLLNLLLKVQTGAHIKSKYVEYIKVNPCSAEPEVFVIPWLQFCINFE